MGFYITGGAFFERDGLGGLQLLRSPLSAPLFDRVDPFVPQPARIQRLPASILKAIKRIRPETHPVSLTIEHVPENPILGALGCDAQIEAIPVPVHATFFGLLDLECCQPLRWHRPQSRPQPLRGLWRTHANVSTQEM